MKKLLAILLVLLSLVEAGAFSLSGLYGKVVYGEYASDSLESVSFDSPYGTYRFTKLSYPDLEHILSVEASKSSAAVGYLASLPLVEVLFSGVSIEVTLKEEGTLDFSASLPFVPGGTYVEKAIPYTVSSPGVVSIVLEDEFSGSFRGKTVLLSCFEGYRSIRLQEKGDEDEVLHLYRD